VAKPSLVPVERIEGAILGLRRHMVILDTLELQDGAERVSGHEPLPNREWLCCQACSAALAQHM